MEKNYLAATVKWRLLVGFLGEKGQFGWRQSAFFTCYSSDFLSSLTQPDTISRRLSDVFLHMGTLTHLTQLQFRLLKNPYQQDRNSKTAKE